MVTTDLPLVHHWGDIAERRWVSLFMCLSHVLFIFQETRHHALQSISDMQTKYRTQEISYENKGEFLPKDAWAKQGWPTDQMEEWKTTRPQVSEPPILRTQRSWLCQLGARD